MNKLSLVGMQLPEKYKENCVTYTGTDNSDYNLIYLLFN